jgi:hypothetical protein
MRLLRTYRSIPEYFRTLLSIPCATVGYAEGVSVAIADRNTETACIQDLYKVTRGRIPNLTATQNRGDVAGFVGAVVALTSSAKKGAALPLTQH